MIYFLLIAAGVGSLGLCLALPVSRYLEKNPALILGLGLFFEATSPLFPGDRWPALGLGPISVYPADLYSVLLAVLVFPFIYSKLIHGFSKNELPLVLFLIWGVVLGINYLLGIKGFGIQAATNEFRGYLSVVLVVLYIYMSPPEQIWRIVEKYWIYAAALLVLIAVFGYRDGDLSRQGRPLDSHPTYFILEAGIIGLFLFSERRLKLWLIPICAAFFPMVLLLQHRSVWAVALLAIALITFFLPRIRSYLVKVGGIGSVFCIALAITFFGDEVMTAIGDSYEEAISVNEAGESTMYWRIEGWLGLLQGEQMQSAQQILIGNPFGTGWEREVTTSGGQQIARDVSPHNYYIQNMLRSGLLGLACFIMVYAITIARLLHLSARLSEHRGTLLCLCIILLTQVTFYLVYASDYTQAMLLGLGMAWGRLYIPKPATI